jgi:hypothetical protein
MLKQWFLNIQGVNLRNYLTTLAINKIVKNTFWWAAFLQDVAIDVHLAAGLERGQHPGHLQATAPRTLNTTQYKSEE